MHAAPPYLLPLLLPTSPVLPSLVNAFLQAPQSVQTFGRKVSERGPAATLLCLCMDSIQEQAALSHSLQSCIALACGCVCHAHCLLLLLLLFPRRGQQLPSPTARPAPGSSSSMVRGAVRFKNRSSSNWEGRRRGPR
jgi:hypothetical protein